MPWFFDRDFFISVVHLLNAGDVGARVVNVAGESFGIEVELEDGSKVVWSNTDCKDWGYTMVLPSGDQETFRSDVAWDRLPEVVATLVATHSYGEELVSPE